MSLKNFIGTLSPLYGAVTGEGAMGKMLNPSEAKRIADEESARSAAAAEQANTAHQARMKAEATGGMKKGGKVRTASQRADGCCIRGKTRA